MGAFAMVAAVFAAPAAHAEETKYAAFCMDYESNEVLFDRYADAQRYPASLTKMMTLALLFDALEDGRVTLDTKMKVSSYAAGTAPSKLGLKAGDKITVKDAIGALAVKSANDIAVVVAEHIGGSEAKFAQMMNDKAKVFAMDNTHFENPHGLPNKKQITTARDMTILLTSLIKYYPDYRDYLSMQSFSYNGRTWKNHNSLIVDGESKFGKTGYTVVSGFNLASNDEEFPIGCTVMGGRTAKTRDAHFKMVMDDVTNGYGEIMVARLNAAQLKGGLATDLPRGGVSAMAQITILNEVQIASTQDQNVQQGDVVVDEVDAPVTQQLRRGQTAPSLKPR